MVTYISFLRGINVSGSKLIKMEQLKKLYIDLLFSEVQTYIQSGNVIFHSPEKDIKSLENRISVAIKAQFGFEVPVIILSLETLLNILKTNPFWVDDPDTNCSDLYVTLLKDVPQQEFMDKLIAYDFTPEKVAVRNKVIFLFLPKGYGNTKFNNNFFESKLKTPATTRNWKTLKTLASIAGSHPNN